MSDAPVLLVDLAARPRWVAWQVEGRGPQGKPTKVPHNPKGGKAKADDPATWGTREQAAECAAKLPLPFGIGGVGLELGDHDDFAIGGLDLDTSLSDAGELAPWAGRVLERFRTYAEVSPSGSGIKLFFTYDPADAPAIRQAMGTATGRKWAKKGGDHPPGIELYISGRFFAVTEQRYADAPAELHPMSLVDLLWLIRDAGPGMTAGTVRPPDGMSESRTYTSGKPAGGDGSRSAMAFKVATQVKRHGGDFSAFLEALEAEPDTAAWKAEKGQANGGRELRRCWERAEQAVDQDVLLTEHGVAEAFAKRFKDRLRYCHDTGAWFEWTGTHWRQDRKHAAFSFARALVAEANQEAEFKTQAITGKAAFAGGVERFAQRDPVLAVTSEVWDRDPFLLGTPGGVVDLRTGALRPAQPSDFITRMTAVVPAEVPHHPVWDRFLLEATGGDHALIRFLRQWYGYSLTGDTREHALLFNFGPGGNGKGVLLNTISGIMGAYACAAAMDTFMASPGDRHPTDLAMLRGARLVTASETEEGRQWAEARIKSLTGGDPIRARFMRQDFFEYRPTFKLSFAGNHRPVLRNVDEAVKRRFNLMPFVHVPAFKDLQLEERLKLEWPAILRWMIEGCLDWLMNGLVRPPAITLATSDYFSEQDTMGQWIEDACQVAPGFGDTHSSLWTSWCSYARNRGEDPGGSKGFSQALFKRGFKAIKNSHGIQGRGVGGIKVKVYLAQDEAA